MENKKSYEPKIYTTKNQTKKTQYSNVVRGKKSLEIRARKKHSEKHKDNIDNVELWKQRQ